MGDNVIITVTLTLLLEINNSMLKTLASSDTVVKVVESQIKLDRLPEGNFA